MVIKISAYNYKAVSIIKQKMFREHRQHHIREANAIRNTAQAMFDQGYIGKEELDDAKLMAIAEENRKCMDRRH